LVIAENPGITSKADWERETNIYSVCRLCRKSDAPDHSGLSWQYWEETEKGQLVPGSDIETDFDDCPMWPGWLIPAYGEHWGHSYCEKYKGDLYLVEATHSALNDGTALAAWALTFVKPGGRTSINEVRKAPNLSTLPGSAEDVTTYVSGKSGDMGWTASHVQRAEQRLGVAFLLMSAARREGERVTAEEVQRVAQELDQAMGGLYTQVAQGSQWRMVNRFIRLHEDTHKDIPTLPPGIVDVEVVTGVDALGRSVETQALKDYGTTLSELFPQQVQQVIDAHDFATRLASGLGIKPDGLVPDPAQVQQEEQAKMSQATLMQMATKAAGPIGGSLAKGAVDAYNAPPQPPQNQQ
jgi:hypothetical protein